MQFWHGLPTSADGVCLRGHLAQGVPVVSTAELGTRDVLREGLGVHIAQEDAADFSAKVIRLLNDSALRETLGAAGRDYAHGWSASRLAQRMQEFYQQVLAARGLREDRMAPSGAATRAQPH